MGADTFDRKSTIPSHKLSLPLNPVSGNKIGYYISYWCSHVPQNLLVA